MYANSVFQTVDEITCVYEDEAVIKRRELSKRVIDVAGPWVTIAFVFQDFRGGEWQPVRYSIQKWRRVAGAWRKHSAVNLRPETARAVALLLDEWGSMGDAIADLSA